MSNSVLPSIVATIDHLHGCVLVDLASGGVVASAGLEPGGGSDLVDAIRACAALAEGDAPGRAILERETGALVFQQVRDTHWAALTFDDRAPLGLVRLLSADVAGDLARTDLPQAAAPPPSRAAEPPPPQPAPDPVPIASAPSPGRKLLDYLDANAPDTHAALLRVSLQTGLPLSLLKTPDELSTAEFEQVTLSVQRILGVEMLAL